MRRALLWCMATACLPAFDDPTAVVDEPRILAVRSEPAEARPGDPVRWRALIAAPEDATPDTVPEWAWCLQPRAVDERTAVTAACLTGEDRTPIPAQTPVPTDACARFGPNPPPTTGDEPPRRPADPDPTGGYYLPVHAGTDEAEAFGFVRLRCDLPGVTRAVFDAFQDRYRTNQHPGIIDFDAPPETEAGVAHTLVLRTDDKAAEPFVRYDVDIADLVDETETLTAHWYTTGGALGRSASPVIEGQASVEWTAGPGDEPIQLWVVVRDNRGGVSWETATVPLR
ncbi:MAG: hypothetical protein AB8H79_14595 [Myxococcota bacterium]